MANITIHFEISNEHLIAALLQWRLEKQAPEKQTSPKKKSRLMASLEEKKGQAPWGLKKDGTPKKRPGRAPKGAK